MIEITAGDGHVLSAYRAEPTDAPKGAVIVLQEIFGVNANIRQIVDAFASQGYLAVAPSLFDRVQKQVELGYDEEGLNQGLEIVRQIPLETSLNDLRATLDSVKSAGKVAVVGYDWGAYVAFHAANRVEGLACAVTYYGAGITQERGLKRRIPTMLHFGSLDRYISISEVIQFRAARPDVSVYDYPAGHGFACSDRDTYDAPATEKAWERTLTMISHRLVGPPKVTLTNQGAYAAAKPDKKKKAVVDEMDAPM
jgi:carboxymethylenebutenolidase